jgi:tetratricopeptide (TPR) repeat protein
MSLTDAELPRQSDRQTSRPPARNEEVWVLDDPTDLSLQSATRVDTSRASAADDRVNLPNDIVEELTGAVGREQARKIASRMAIAARAYERDRYPEAFRITRSVVDLVPESAAAHELHGLVCYRLGRWREASKHLEAARTLNGDDPSQLPIIMDCRRAQGQHRKVEALWEELRSTSPPADVLAEGRLVLAAHRADRGELDSAIELLDSAGAGRNLRRPASRHLRQWYVLADLYERAGDIPRARDLFARVATADPEVADATERLIGLGRLRRSRRRPAPGKTSGAPGRNRA